MRIVVQNAGHARRRIRALAILHVAGGVVAFVIGVLCTAVSGSLLWVLSRPGPSEPTAKFSMLFFAAFLGAVSVVFLPASVFSLLVGLGMRRFIPLAKWGAIAVSALGVLSFLLFLAV